MEAKAKPKRKAKSRGRPITSVGEAASTTILKAAVEEFGLHGFDGANITNIAERAGVAKPLVHYHFKTKDNLWYAAVQHVMSELQSDMGKLEFEIRNMDAVEAFKLAVRKYAHFCTRNPNFARMLLSEVVRDNDRAAWIQKEYQAPAYQLFASLHEIAIGTGRLKSIPSYHILPMINGAINAFTADRGILKSLYNVDTTDPRVLEQHLEILIDIFLNGLIIDPEQAT